MKTGTSEKTIFDNETIISESGQYTVVAKDIVGNETSVAFSIDKEVSATASPNIVSGQIISESISFKFDEPMNSIILIKDGVEMQYRTGNISEPGQYVLTVEDSIGNVAEWSWMIIAKTAQSYNISVPKDYKVSAVIDGSVISDIIVDGAIKLIQNGAYTLYFESELDSSLNYSVEIVLDSIAPTVEIEVGKSSAVISNPNKEGLSFVLFKDGKQIDFSLGSTLTSAGKYKLVVTDSIGNTNEYEFELKYINAPGIIVIVVLCAVAVIVAVLIIKSRRNQRIK